MYAIRHFCHRTDISIGHHAFSIDLDADWKKAVGKSGLVQEQINHLIGNCGRLWLDAAGFNGVYDPDNSGFDRDKSKPPGPNACPFYEPNRDLRVDWGEWGPEHITVPGNACGLDIDRSAFGCLFEHGARLCPHNVDSLAQKYLLTIVFTEIAESVILFRDRIADDTDCNASQAAGEATRDAPAGS